MDMFICKSVINVATLRADKKIYSLMSGLVAEWIRHLPSTQTAGVRSSGWAPPDS